MSFKYIVSHDARRAIYVVLSVYISISLASCSRVCVSGILCIMMQKGSIYIIYFCLLGYVISIMLCDLGTLWIWCKKSSTCSSFCVHITSVMLCVLGTLWVWRKRSSHWSTRWVTTWSWCTSTTWLSPPGPWWPPSWCRATRTWQCGHSCMKSIGSNTWHPTWEPTLTGQVSSGFCIHAPLSRHVLYAPLSHSGCF